VQDREKKVFNTQAVGEDILVETVKKEEFKPKFELLDKAY
jgi:hypothetical protein